MINTRKIKARMVEKGKTFQSIAPKVPISAYSLGQQVSNKKAINLDTVQILCEELDITEEEFSEFFLQK